MVAEQKYYDLDLQLGDENRPRIKFRDEEYFVKDVTAREVLLYQRRVKTKQEMLAAREEAFENAIEEQILVPDEDNPIDLEEVEAQREHFANELAEIFASALTSTLVRIVKTEKGDKDAVDEEGRIKTEPMSDELALTISQREFAALQEAILDIAQGGGGAVEGNAQKR